MPLQKGSPDTDGWRMNFLTRGRGRPDRGRLFPNFHRGNRGQPSVNTTERTDGACPPTCDPPKQDEPQKEMLTFEQNLERLQLSEASQQLIEREERLFGEMMETNALIHQEEDVNKLITDRRALEDLVNSTLRTSLSQAEVNENVLTSAVKAISQEEMQDWVWSQRSPQTSPAWRPSGWKNLHDSVIQSLVEERMMNPANPTMNHDSSSVQLDICSMGKQLKEDLLWVVEVVKKCYPPEENICQMYAKLYHQTFAARLRTIAEFVLNDRDGTYILLWINDFYPSTFCNPKLGEIDIESLENLLPDSLLAPLEEQFLNKQQHELTEYTKQVLEQAEQDWTARTEPKKEDGCFVSHVACDIIELIHSAVKEATHVLGSQNKVQSMMCVLTEVLQSFSTFLHDVMKQNKVHSKSIIKANLRCVEQFRDFIVRKSDLFPDSVRKSSLTVLTEMKQSVYIYLLGPVHKNLKPHYRKIGTQDWLKRPELNNLLESIEDQMMALEGLAESCHQELIGQLQQEVTVEYVRMLLKGKVQLQDREKQLRAYTVIKDNSESLNNLFTSMGSKEDWLKDVLTEIAEVLKLQDIAAIQMQVVSLGNTFPDLSERHVSALLKLKSNISTPDRRKVKETLLDTLSQTCVTDARPFFSKVKVKGALFK
ncbi:tumor necrosis factor alpha-induced protein 2-like isoform X2 [Thalassophryne amazonica]|nr:tumor necrosis factor alpha-induced protein 2-like isoform X2 [Thalassophryne amazonica]